MSHPALDRTGGVPGLSIRAGIAKRVGTVLENLNRMAVTARVPSRIGPEKAGTPLAAIYPLDC